MRWYASEMVRICWASHDGREVLFASSFNNSDPRHFDHRLNNLEPSANIGDVIKNLYLGWKSQTKTYKYHFPVRAEQSEATPCRAMACHTLRRMSCRKRDNSSKLAFPGFLSLHPNLTWENYVATCKVWSVGIQDNFTTKFENKAVW